jgi:hypothetical protein
MPVRTRLIFAGPWQKPPLKPPNDNGVHEAYLLCQDERPK